MYFALIFECLGTSVYPSKHISQCTQALKNVIATSVSDVFCTKISVSDMYFALHLNVSCCKVSLIVFAQLCQLKLYKLNVAPLN